MDTKRMFRRFLWVLGVGLSVAAVSTAPASDMGMAAANQVSQSSIYDYMDIWLYTHTGSNRGVGGAQHNLCRDSVAALMTSYGLTVTVEPFTYNSVTYHNVVGTKLGSAYPESEYVVGAHYDSVSNAGADDNASGVALVLECARILSQYDSDYTLRFVAFSREEQGLIGSEAYVADHSMDDIRGMYSADMVAYSTLGNTQANVYRRTTSPVANALQTSITLYSNGLTPYNAGWISASDHASFDAGGFDAALLIEYEVWDNPYYHTSQDTFEQSGNLNFPYAVKMTRAMVGCLVEIGRAHV